MGAEQALKVAKDIRKGREKVYAEDISPILKEHSKLAALINENQEENTENKSSASQTPEGDLK